MSHQSRICFFASVGLALGASTAMATRTTGHASLCQEEGAGTFGGETGAVNRSEYRVTKTAATGRNLLCPVIRTHGSSQRTVRVRVLTTGDAYVSCTTGNGPTPYWWEWVDSDPALAGTIQELTLHDVSGAWLECELSPNSG